MKAIKGLILAGLGFMALTANIVAAADLGDSLKDTPVPGYSVDYGSGWMIRGRVIGVLPDAGASNIVGLPDGSDVDIDDAIVPELDITYFFNKNFALELILAVTPHEITGKGAIDGLDVGEAWLLPPTLLAQYHFDVGHGIKPYVGAGINYTIFFEDDGAAGSLDLDNSFGWALQAGVDIHLRDNWYFNVDVKKLWLDTDVTIGGAVTADVDIDPWIIGAGLGYRFGGVPSPLK